MIRTDKRTILALGFCGATSLALAHCSGTGNHGNAASSDESTGSVDLALQLANGSSLNTLNYTITGPSGFSKVGQIDIANTNHAGAVIAGIPAGSGFSISLTGSSTDAGTQCSGSATFDVVANQTVPVTVPVLCHEAATTGSLLLNGTLNICPVIDGIGATPNDVYVGATIGLSALVHDSDNGPNALTYAWAASSGTLSDPTAQNPTLTCTQPGPVTLGLTVSDGDPSPSCFATSTVQVNCSVAPAAISGIILLTGADETQRVVNWYASANTNQVVEVAATDNCQDGFFPGTKTVYTAVVTANAVNGGYNGHAVLGPLQENTSYCYRVGGDGAWSTPYPFKTHKFTGDFDFLFFGDPQIGSSGNVPKDQAGWEDTMKVAVGANPDAELLVSGGDQVETANVETQWTAFLAPSQLRSYPWVATIGNHDVGGLAYQQHLWTPNTDRSPSHYASTSTTISGGDYWFLYKGVLFIDLNSNAYSTSGQSGVNADTAHIAFITDVIAQHGAQAKYKVLVYHHSIYSPASHANDSDNQKRRADFPAAFSNLGVDLVLQGHDHVYSRSYLIDHGAKQNADEQPGATTVAKGPGGVIYVTANSASGSKYYALSCPRTSASDPACTTPRQTSSYDPLYGADPLNPQNHWANSVENQENVRTYVKVLVRDNALTVQNYRSGTCAAPNAAFEVGNVAWCGPNGGTSAALPVGSVVDSVAISH